MDSSQYIIEEFKESDRLAVARLHKESLPIGFLSGLGLHFLGELYSGLASAPHTCVYVARHKVDGNPLGFIAATANIHDCYKFVLKSHFWGLSKAALSQIWRPGVLKKMVETLKYAPSDYKNGNDRPLAELLAIAVDAEARGMKIGQNLVLAWESEFERWHIANEYITVTDADNPKSNKFYQVIGFEKYRKFKHHQHYLYEYRKRLHTDG